MLLFIILAVLCVAGTVRAQFTQVSGTITDPNGLPYSPATINATLSPPGVTSPTVNRQSFSASLNGSTSTAGTFSMTLADNNVVLPAGTRWQFTVCATPGVAPPFGFGSVCFTSTITITGASQSITTQLTAAAPRLTRIGGGASGTVLVSGNFSLSTRWGSTATVTNIVGTDLEWRATVTPNGSGIAIAPQITLTFASSVWTNGPVCQTKQVDGSAQRAILNDTATATTLVVIFNDTPIAGATYIISGICEGR